jgi:hypothetical protein
MILSFIQEIELKNDPVHEVIHSVQQENISSKDTTPEMKDKMTEKIDYSFDSSFESKYVHFKEKIEKDRLAWETLARRK